MLKLHCARSIMSNSVKCRWLSVPLLVLSLQFCLAQAPSGPKFFAFNSASTAVYDLSAIYDFDQDIIGSGGTAAPLAITGLPLTQATRAVSTGGWNAFVTVMVGDSAVAAVYNGHRRSAAGATPARVQLTFGCPGRILVAGVETGFSISVQLRPGGGPGEPVAAGVGARAGQFYQVLRRPSHSDSISVPLPAGVDGNLERAIGLWCSLGHLVGSGDHCASNGRILPVRVSGVFGHNMAFPSPPAGFRSADGDGRGSLLRMISSPAQPSPICSAGQDSWAKGIAIIGKQRARRLRVKLAEVSCKLALRF